MPKVIIVYLETVLLDPFLEGIRLRIDVGSSSYSLPTRARLVELLHPGDFRRTKRPGIWSRLVAAEDAYQDDPPS